MRVDTIVYRAAMMCVVVCTSASAQPVAPLPLTMGEAARRVQAEEYGAQLMGERYVRLYQEAIG